MQETEYDFGRILSDFQDAVYTQAYRMLGSKEEAEDATQDIFLQIHGSLDRFEGRSKVSTWVYRITANVCVSRLRKKQRMSSGLGRFAGHGERMPLEFALDQRDDPEREYAAKQAAECIRNEVRNLPPLWAQVISLHYFGGRSYDQIAEAMGLPRGTVATYMSRGRNRLAKRMTARLGRDAICLR